MAKTTGRTKKHLTEFGVGTARGGISYIFGSLVRAFALFLLLIILARLLNPMLFGLYTLAIAFYGIIEVIAYFGIGTALRKRIPEAKKNEEIMAIITGGYIYSVAIGIVLAIVGFALSNYIAVNIYNNPAVGYLLQIASITVIVDVLFNVGTSSLVGLIRNRDAAVSNVIYSISSLVFSPLLFLLGYGVAGALIGLLIGYVVGAAISFWYLLKSISFKFVMPTRKIIDELTYFSIPVFVSNMSNIGATNFGILFFGASLSVALGASASASILGNYGAAYKLGSFATVILSSATFVLLPAFSHAFVNKKLSKRISAVYNGSLYYTMLFLLAAVAYAISVSVPLNALLFSYNYNSAPVYFAIIATGIAIGVIGTYAGTLLIGRGNVRRFMFYQVIVAAVEIASMILLIPSLGAIGLLISFYVIGPILSDILYSYVLAKKFSISLRIMPLVRLFAASAFLCLILLGVTLLLHQSRFTIAINAVIALLIYPPILVLFKAVKKENLEFLMQISNKMHVIEVPAKHFISYTMRFVKE